MAEDFHKYGFPDGKRYSSFVGYFKRKYGERLQKIVLDAGFTCPNRDGKVGKGGCTYCDNAAFHPSYSTAGKSLHQQLDEGIEFHKVRYRTTEHYLAYFQSFSNTYAPESHLRQLYYEAIAPEDIAGLAIGTRPDCLSGKVVQLLREINEIKPVSVELGLQTTNPASVRYIRRGYENEVYFDAVRRLKAAGIEVVTHIILGLPEETPETAAKTTADAVAAGTDGVKFHLLHVLRGTDLEKEYLQGKFRCLELEEYAHWLKTCLKEVPPHVTVHRITGDGAKRDLVAPLWSADKKRVLNYLNTYLQQVL